MMAAGRTVPSTVPGTRYDMKYFQKSDLFLIGAAFISFVLSVSLWFYGYKDEGLFVGLWVPSILSFGCYFKQMLNK